MFFTTPKDFTLSEVLMEAHYREQLFWLEPEDFLDSVMFTTT